MNVTDWFQFSHLRNYDITQLNHVIPWQGEFLANQTTALKDKEIALYLRRHCVSEIQCGEILRRLLGKKAKLHVEIHHADLREDSNW